MSEFENILDQARATLIKKRQEIKDKIKGLEDELYEIGREFKAIEAYERAKQGKNKKQVRTSGRRTAILELLSKKAMSRQEILTALEAKGDKRAEQSISNTLSILKKADRIGLENGIYSSKMT